MFVARVVGGNVLPETRYPTQANSQVVETTQGLANHLQPNTFQVHMSNLTENWADHVLKYCEIFATVEK